MTINKFFGEYRWLSNFHVVDVEFEGRVYPSTEHAYQAAKSDNEEIREMFSKIETPGKAKMASLALICPPGWHESRKFEVMEQVLREKFLKNEVLKKKLLDTGSQDLIEGNTWHDNCWGTCTCPKCGNSGQNNLGKILMKIRKEAKTKTMAHTTKEWWTNTKSNPEKLANWLQRQYVGELAAVNLLSEVLLKFGGQASTEEWDIVYRVMGQEALHAHWMRDVCVDRKISLKNNASSQERYWKEVLPNITSFHEAMDAAFHAEHMRLERIREIAADKDPEISDLVKVFAKILPHEEWHEEVFGGMRQTAAGSTTRYHKKGLEALNLVLSD